MYLQEIRKTQLLKPAEEVALAARIQAGDKAARDHMISANLRLVVKIAMDYKDFGLPLMDLISEGNLGLIKAVGRFDPSKGGKLSTYAAWWIKQYIKRALANQSKTIRLPVHLLDKVAKMRRATLALSEQLGRDPSNDELAAELGVSASRVAHLKSVTVQPASLDAPVGDDSNSSSFGELVGDEKDVNPADSLSNSTEEAALKKMIADLDPREAEIIRLRFGFDGNDELTLEEIGEKFHVTRERVRQLQNLALSRLRKAIEANRHQSTKEEILERAKARGSMEVFREFARAKALA